MELLKFVQQMQGNDFRLPHFITDDRVIGLSRRFADALRGSVILAELLSDSRGHKEFSQMTIPYSLFLRLCDLIEWRPAFVFGDLDMSNLGKGILYRQPLFRNDNLYQSVFPHICRKQPLKTSLLFYPSRGYRGENLPWQKQRIIPKEIENKLALQGLSLKVRLATLPEIAFVSQARFAATKERIPRSGFFIRAENLEARSFYQLAFGNSEEGAIVQYDRGNLSASSGAMPVIVLCEVA